MPEAHFWFRRLRSRLLSAERGGDVAGRKIAHIRLDRRVAFARQPEPGAMRMEQVEQAVVRPVERIDAERVFARRDSKRHRDEEAPFEGPDLRNVTLDAELGLAADDVAANGGGEARGHAAHGVVALGDVAVDSGVAGTESHGALLS